jgi:hypothetical protein
VAAMDVPAHVRATCDELGDRGIPSTLKLFQNCYFRLQDCFLVIPPLQFDCNKILSRQVNP